MTDPSGSSLRPEIRATRKIHAVWMAVALAVAMAFGSATPASAAGTIQPGAAIVTGGAGCTLAWLFERSDTAPDGTTTSAVFGSTAAHCVERVGQEVTLAEDGSRIGEVAFLGNADEEGRDYAFIRIDQAAHGQVNAAMAGHPAIPTGLAVAPAEGDLMQFSGHGLGFEATAPTRERRQGILNRLGDKEHAILGVVLFGDSGGPVADLDDGGTAFGIVNTVGAGVYSDSLAIAHAGEGGANLNFVLADAAARGFSPGQLCVAGQPCG